MAGACEHEANNDSCESDGNVCTDDVCVAGAGITQDACPRFSRYCW